MPTAREALLDAALSALSARPWTTVRMVDVAVAAGVSRQTLYNEFGSKDGLARALLRRAADSYLTGAARALDARGDLGDGPTELALWTVRAARANVLVKALLTGAWEDRLPRPGEPRPGRPGPVEPRPGEPRPGRPRPGELGPPPVVTARRPADAVPPTPAELLVTVRDRAVAALAHGRPQEAADLEVACEIALRLALSYAMVPPVTAPSPMGSDAVSLLREALARHAPGRLTGRERCQCEEPDSCRPITPTITSEMDTSLRVETTSSRKTIP
ncbi:TetR/AcrR family transcriptional regulator [Streptomyces sp. NBC_01102]|uniref:TetR family transcriptional regulator n=1 Tax=unclassified Streptomyces TaxID=2593676 RepID=UPI00386DB9FF|nr:TetR/AcrR family transcriptional regulator [Streptomyces sp. NBC_01102]